MNHHVGFIFCCSDVRLRPMMVARLPSCLRLTVSAMPYLPRGPDASREMMRFFLQCPPRVFQPKADLDASSEPVEASVKWFNADKGSDLSP
jgi:hypothetical protein